MGGMSLFLASFSYFENKIYAYNNRRIVVHVVFYAIQFVSKEVGDYFSTELLVNYNFYFNMTVGIY